MTEPTAAPAGATTSLAGKAALVTGAATGIGKAIAAALAAAGASVVINHNHMPEPAGKVVAEITAAGGTAIAAAADVSIRAEYQAMVEQMLAEFGRWDILVNNAAVAVTKPFGEITEAEFDLSFAVNVKGVFHGLQLAWEHLAEGGRIITISSSTTGLMLPGYAVYDGTKGAVEQFTRILSKEFGLRGITVQATRFHVPALGAISLLGAWLVIRAVRQAPLAVVASAVVVVTMFGLGLWSFHNMLNPQHPGPARPPHCNIGQPHCPS